MKLLTRRRWVVAATAAGSLGSLVLTALGPAPAHAVVVPVYDPARFFQMIALLDQVEALTSSLTEGLTQLRNAASSLGRGNLVDDILIGHRNLTSDLRTISYRMETVSTQFRRVFPNEEAARNTPSSDVDELRSGWNQEIHHSALAASRAQTALSNIERNTASANAILEASKETTQQNEGSELAKLQAVVQMLGVINSDLTTLATTIAATERVNTSVAATDAAEYDVATEQARRMMRGYASPSGQIRNVDSRLLR